MGTLGDDVWQQILNDCDGNNDGMISYEEFVRMLKNKKLWSTLYNYNLLINWYKYLSL